MDKKTLLLGTSALVAAAIAGTPALAGQVGSKDAYSIELGGKFRYNVGIVSQDIEDDLSMRIAAANDAHNARTGATEANNTPDPDPYGGVDHQISRGYKFVGDESELTIRAEATADNGLKYGVDMTLNAGAADSSPGDKVYAFINSDNWGDLELGENDDASDRMYVESDDILVGRGGFDGDVGDFFNFGEARGGTGNDGIGGQKINYFSPRFGGVQIGLSFTPDDGAASGNTSERDNNGSQEDIYSLAANYVGNFGDAEVVLAVTGAWGDVEDDGDMDPDNDLEGPETISVGANVSFSGFAVGAGYVDFGDRGFSPAQQRLGADRGSYWTIGASYNSGPWGISVGYLDTGYSNARAEPGAPAAPDTEANVFSIDVAYNVAPGWDMAFSANWASADNIFNSPDSEGAVNNDGSVFVLSNAFSF